MLSVMYQVSALPVILKQSGGLACRTLSSRIPGSVLLGFRFNRGDGYQYGWARIKTSGDPLYKLILVDYAWADPGESLQTGQVHSADKTARVTDRGSLGLLALGGAGLLAWRKRRTTSSVKE